MQVGIEEKGHIMQGDHRSTGKTHRTCVVWRVEKLEPALLDDGREASLFPYQPASRALVWDQAPFQAVAGRHADQMAGMILGENDPLVIAIQRCQSAHQVDNIVASADRFRW